jgi:transcriptional regulator with XRE-family HTH domain
MERVSANNNENHELIAIGQAIRSQRTALHLSQEALADAAGLDRSHMGRIERGQRNLSIRNFRRIADALQMRPSELLRKAGL